MITHKHLSKLKFLSIAPTLTENEVEEVTAALKSGWLTSGPRVRRFEREFADAVGASQALAVNSCTAALHLAVERPGVGAGNGRARSHYDFCRDRRGGSLSGRGSDSRSIAIR